MSGYRFMSDYRVVSGSMAGGVESLLILFICRMAYSEIICPKVDSVIYLLSWITCNTVMSERESIPTSNVLTLDFCWADRPSRISALGPVSIKFNPYGRAPFATYAMSGSASGA